MHTHIPGEVCARVRIHAYVRACACVCGHRVCVYVHEEREREGERKATEQSAEPRSIVSTRLERLNRSTSLLLYALCAPRTRAPNERTPTVPHRTPTPLLSVSFSFSSGFHTVSSTFPALFLSGSPLSLSRSLFFSLSRRQTIDQPSHANARFQKCPALGAVRASLFGISLPLAPFLFRTFGPPKLVRRIFAAG